MQNVLVSHLIGFCFLFFSCAEQSTSTLPKNDSASIFGKKVYVFSDTMQTEYMQSIIDSIATIQDHRNQEFGPNRVALLFKPGTYRLKIHAGYYTQVTGLGKSPSDVVIQGGVESRQVRNTALSNFWRSAENMTVIPENGTNYWVVSQAAPFRRMHVKGNLAFSKGGYTSGGFLSNSVVDGKISSGTQQQFFTRNSTIGSWDGYVWNMMFLGVDNAPVEQWPKPPFTTIDKTPRIREKPFIYIDDSGTFKLFVPAIRENVAGTDWFSEEIKGKEIDFTDVYVAHEGVDDAKSINAALAEKKHLLFTPGRYYLNETIQVNHPRTVILGIGYPSIIPTKGQTAMQIADVDDVTLAGITFDAGPIRSEVLLEVGPKSSSNSHAENPTFLMDVFCRVGTDKAGIATSCVIINSNDVIADHFWLWRADHGPSAVRRPGWDINLGENGLTVNGDDVTIYGLFVEHFTQFQTLWNGEWGKTYFYQSEMPYDPPSQEEWKNGTTDGYASYKVADHVLTHQAWALGIYNTFQDAPVFAERAVEVPNTNGVQLKHLTTFYLSGKGGGIRHVINDVGDAASEKKREQKVRIYPVE